MKKLSIISFLFMLACFGTSIARAEEPLCNELLSGLSSEVQVSIHDLAKLRYDLDQRTTQGLQDFLTRAMKTEFDRKWLEVLSASGLSSDALSSVVRSEIQKIQPQDEISKKVTKDRIQEEVNTGVRIETVGSIDFDGRFSHSQTLLPDGRLLIAGGFTQKGQLARVEVANPTTGKMEVVGELQETRVDHGASVLQDGRVVLSGGLGPRQNILSSIEAIDSNRNEIKIIGKLLHARHQFGQTTLLDGRVLIAGGWNNGGLGSVEVFDPQTATTVELTKLNEARSAHVQILLPNGEVALVGGYSKSGYLSSIEVINPISKEVRISGNLIRPRLDHRVTVLPNGKLLVGGGKSGFDEFVADIEIFDFTTGKSEVIGELNDPRTKHAQSLLSDGTVLVSGGSALKNLNSVELIDPRTGLSYPIGQLSYPRYHHSQIMRSDGSVFVVGGMGSPTDSVLTELIRLGGK